MFFTLPGNCHLSVAEDRQNEGQYEDENFHSSANLVKILRQKSIKFIRTGKHLILQHRDISPDA